MNNKEINTHGLNINLDDLRAVSEGTRNHGDYVTYVFYDDRDGSVWSEQVIGEGCWYDNEHFWKVTESSEEYLSPQKIADSIFWTLSVYGGI